MAKYEFTADGEVILTENLKNDDEALDRCVELSLAYPTKVVDWRRVYE